MSISSCKSLVYAGILGILTFTLSSCTPWPTEGGGGISERHAIESPELALLENRLNASIERGSRTYYAAQTAEAEIQLTRARRAWDAGFVADYAIEYQKLDILVQDIEGHLSSSSHNSGKRLKQ